MKRAPQPRWWNLSRLAGPSFFVLSDLCMSTVFLVCLRALWTALAGALGWRGQSTRGQVGAVIEPRTISVVIPTLNEAAGLVETVRRAQALPSVREIIVVDGDSTDETRTLAERLGCAVRRSARGRGAQMRLGAQQAKEDVVMLLHADTWLPEGADQAVLSCLRDPRVVAGGFWKVFREKHPFLLGSRVRCGLRLFLFNRVLGDQVVFVRRRTLEEIGGVPDLPLMEEYELCRRLRSVGRLALARATVSTSARRFLERGVLRTYARMGYVTFRYWLGTPAHELRKIYEKE
jgi:rSAM/selenodomain-associated transferase 2